MSDKNYQNARTYEPGKVNLQLFGRDEDVAVNRMAEVDSVESKDGRAEALVVITGQLLRIADALEALVSCVEYVPPTEYERRNCPDAEGYYKLRIGGEVYEND